MRTQRTVIVTGASSGLGAEVARALARDGTRVIMAVRDPARAPDLSGRAEARVLDLADLASVRAFAATVDEPVDVLINNAGVMAVPEGRTVDGFERHLGVNHLGPFVLTGLLLGRIRERVVTVSSGLHVLGRFPPRRRYQRWLAYGSSKLANLLFAYELQRRLARAGRPVRSIAAHPGLTSTEGQRRDTSLQGKILAGGAAQPVEMGALPLLYAATAPDVPGGACAGPDGFLQRHGRPTLVRTSRRSYDAALAAELWAYSEQQTGFRYDPAMTSSATHRATPTG
jgi:NAD(P)-dependent dehydrogenase (short-subunit alcohol dehydrogenase family)